MIAVIKFILGTCIICSLYTGELCVITDLFMPRGKWQFKRVIEHGIILGSIYSYLIYKFGMSDDLWYVGLGAFILNNLLHQGKLKVRIWVFFVTYAISVGGEGIICILLDQLYTAVGYEGTSWLIDDVIPHFGAFLMAIGVSSLLKRTPLYQKDLEVYNDLSKLKSIGLGLIGIIYAVVFNMISIMYIYGEHIQLGTCVIFIGIYFTLFLMVLSIAHNQMKLKKLHAFRENGILNKALSNHLSTYSHLEEIEKANEEMRREIEKEIEELTGLVGEQERQQLRPYIERIKKTLEPEAEQIVTGNEMLDIILHEKARNAEKLGIAIETNVSIPDTLKISILDLCIIIECTMDYIIKACHAGNEMQKKIKVKGLWFKGYLMFEIWHTLNQAEQGEERIGYAKLPSELEIVMRCLRKYDGNIELTQENNLGKVELSFNTVGGVTCLSYS